MALFLLSHLPIPTLKHYCILSFGLLTIVFLYAQKVFINISNDQYIHSEEFNSTYLKENGYVYTIYKALSYEPWCIWTLINFAYCTLLLFGKMVQRMVFGDLRMIEYQHIKSQFWNYIFLKFIFIFGVLNLENANEVGMWCTWFSIIGFLAIHSQICKDRYEYLTASSFSPTIPLWSHIKVIALLNCIICVCMCLIGISIFVEYQIGFSIGLFMFAEAFALIVRTLYVIAKYTVHLWDFNYVNQWYNKGTVSYYIDFIFEMLILIVDILHYIHMLLYGHFFLSMASVVICLELRRLFYDLRKRIRRHANYLRIIDKMEKRFPWANKDEIDETDKCVVCWEPLDKARKLPCSHMFHHNCLRSWLELDTSCPTCRKNLQDEKDQPTAQQQQQLQAQQLQQQQQQGQQDQQAAAQQPQQQPQQNMFFRRMQRNFFHFDGSRYFSWLPSFSVEVTHNLGNNLPTFLRQNIDEARLNEMSQQVSQVFPHIPLASIIEDLRQTHSAELTIENILEDRVDLANNGEGFESDSDESGSEDTDDADTANQPNPNQVNPTAQIANSAASASSSITSFALNQNDINRANTPSDRASLLYHRKKELIENSKKRFLNRIKEDQQNKSEKNAHNTTTATSSIQETQNLNENDLRLRHRNINEDTN